MANRDLWTPLLAVAAVVVQLGWLFVCMIAFTLLGYDGGGFAGGAISPVVGVLIAFAPTIGVLAYVAWRRAKPRRPR